MDKFSPKVNTVKIIHSRVSQNTQGIESSDFFFFLITKALFIILPLTDFIVRSIFIYQTALVKNYLDFCFSNQRCR